MNKKVVSITQARLSSTRFPRKVIQKINNVSMIELHFNRLRNSKLLTGRILAIADEQDSHKIIEMLSNKSGIIFSFGSPLDVLDRYYQAAINIEADYIVRLTSDCPLVDPELVDKVIAYAIDGDFDYVSNALEPTYPDGMDTEVFKKEALVEAWTNAKENKEREHVTPYLWKNFFKPASKLKIGSYKSEEEDFSRFRLTLDYEEDFLMLTQLINGVGANVGYQEYVAYLKKNNDIYNINSKFIRNEGY